MFRSSGWDAILAALPILQAAAFVSWALNFEAMPGWLHAALIPPAALLFYYNPIVVTHNVLHAPLFRWGPLNLAFSVLNSANLGLPQSLYKHHHLLHHRYNNDPIADGTTRDPSSTWRYGRDGQQEGVISYCALSLLRDSTSLAYAELVRRGDRGLFVSELVSIAAALALLGWMSWVWLLSCWLPVFYLGWFLAHLENYYEHRHAADPSSRFANSVSYLGGLYNVLMFNEGYHQAHHIKPAAHWRERPQVHARYAAEMAQAGAFEAPSPPLLGFWGAPRSCDEGAKP